MTERLTVQGMRSEEDVERLFVEDDVAEVLWARRLGRYGFAVEELLDGRYRARAATWNVLIGREEAVDFLNYFPVVRSSLGRAVAAAEAMVDRLG